MKFYYAVKYSGNPDDIPCLEHEPGAVQFKEAAGDFYNVFNTLHQVPSGGCVYQHKYDTFWYMHDKA